MNVRCKILDPFKQIAIESLFCEKDFGACNDTIIFIEETYYNDVFGVIDELLYCLIHFPGAQVIMLSERDNEHTVNARLGVRDFINEVKTKINAGHSTANLYLYYYDIIKPRKKIHLYLMIFKKYMQIGNVTRVAKMYNLNEKQVYYYINRLKETYGLKSVQNLIPFLNWINNR
ncbi:hypothetical protein [Citrobacter tructae]|uniref:hypothetical protein n=1 Tax=Citrobacter tructae TaxID=2562449 RepID=UPI003F57FFD7